VTIPASALKKLQALRKAQQQHREPFGDTYQGDYIFCSPDGSLLKPDTVSASVSLLFRTLKLPKGASLRTPRHTHGSHLLPAGLSLAECRATVEAQVAKPVTRGRARRSA
jgi:hypothetical protein